MFSGSRIWGGATAGRPPRSPGSPLVLVVAAAEKQAEEEAHAGRDHHRLARVLPHVGAQLVGGLAGLGLHLGVPLADALRRLVVALARGLGLLAQLLAGLLGAAAHVGAHLAVAVLDVLADALPLVAGAVDGAVD